MRLLTSELCVEALSAPMHSRESEVFHIFLHSRVTKVSSASFLSAMQRRFDCTAFSFLLCVVAADNQIVHTRCDKASKAEQHLWWKSLLWIYGICPDSRSTPVNVFDVSRPRSAVYLRPRQDSECSIVSGITPQTAVLAGVFACVMVFGEVLLFLQHRPVLVTVQVRLQGRAASAGGTRLWQTCHSVAMNVHTHTHVGVCM